MPDVSAATNLDSRNAPGWASFLDGLERDLAETMFDLVSDSGPASGSGLASGSGDASGSGPGSDHSINTTWAPPTGLGPLPAHLEDRARALVAATADAHTELAARHLEVGRHLAALQSVPPAVGSRAPVYLDVAG